MMLTKIVLMIRRWNSQKDFKSESFDLGKKYFENHQEVLSYGLKRANYYILNLCGFTPKWNGTAHISELGADINTEKQIYNEDSYMFDLWTFNETIRCPVCGGKILRIGTDCYTCLETQCDFDCSDDGYLSDNLRFSKNTVVEWFPDIEIPFTLKSN